MQVYIACMYYKLHLQWPAKHSRALGSRENQPEDFKHARLKIELDRLNSKKLKYHEKFLPIPFMVQTRSFTGEEDDFISREIASYLIYGPSFSMAERRKK